MCGIVGVVNCEKGIIAKLNGYAQNGCLWGTVRGEDSTGLLQMDRKGAVRVMKSVLDGHDFLQQKKVWSALQNADSTLVTLLHHRAATHGTVSYDNCHPFEHHVGKRYVCGVHNGTVHSFKRKDDDKEFVVDSDWLYYTIARDGAASALGKISYGAYALVWVEKPSNHLFIASNGERPIHWAFVVGENIMLIASEAEMLCALAKRNNIKIECPKFPSSERIYEFDLDGDLRKYTTTEKIKGGTTYAESRPFLPSPSVRKGPNQTDGIIGNTTTDNDTYTKEALAAEGLHAGEPMEFSVEKIKSLDHYRVEITGYVMDNKGGVFEGIIPNMLGSDGSSLFNAEEVICKAAGVKTRIVDGKPTTYIILSTPTSVVKIQEEALVDIPEETSVEIEGPGRRKLPVKKFLELVKHGCSMCSCDISAPMADSLSWQGDSPVCASCTASAADNSLAYGNLPWTN